MLLIYRPGDVVTYVDSAGGAHAAIVKRWDGPRPGYWDVCDLVYVDRGAAVEVSGVGRRRTSTSVLSGYWQPLSEPVTATSDIPAEDRADVDRYPRDEADAGQNSPIVYNGPVYFGPVYFGDRKPEPAVVRVEIDGLDKITT